MIVYASDVNERFNLIETGKETLGRECGREIKQILLEPESQLKHGGRDEHLTKKFPDCPKRYREQVHKENQRVSDGVDFRIGCPATNPAGDLEECDRRKSRHVSIVFGDVGNLRRSDGLPFGVERDDGGMTKS